MITEVLTKRLPFRVQHKRLHLCKGGNRLPKRISANQTITAKLQSIARVQQCMLHEFLSKSRESSKSSDTIQTALGSMTCINLYFNWKTRKSTDANSEIAANLYFI